MPCKSLQGYSYGCVLAHQMGLQLHKAGLEALLQVSGSRAASQAGVHVGVVMFDLEACIILDPRREVQIPSCSAPFNLSRSPGRHRKATIASADTNSSVAKQRLSAVCRRFVRRQPGRLVACGHTARRSCSSAVRWGSLSSP